jgi:hypothetical protein
MKTPWSENIIVYEINKAKKKFKNFWTVPEMLG